ncbi:MAG: hypothetical protein J7J57_01015 [Caldisericaceae bacterium]|nr:hypothetical protein [Caldisericaceae bacterium]
MIFIGFRRQIGRVDVRSVVKYTEEKSGRYAEIYLLHTEPLHSAVQELIEKTKIKEIKTTNFKKEIAKLKEKDKVEVFDLNEFGERRFTKDIC